MLAALAPNAGATAPGMTFALLRSAPMGGGCAGRTGHAGNACLSATKHVALPVSTSAKGGGRLAGANIACLATAFAALMVVARLRAPLTARQAKVRGTWKEKQWRNADYLRRHPPPVMRKKKKGAADRARG